MKFLSSICILVLIFNAHHQPSKCEDELVVIEEVVFEEVDETTDTTDMMTGMTEDPGNVTDTSPATTTSSTTLQPTTPPVDAPQPRPPDFGDTEVGVEASATFTNEIYNTSLTNPEDPYFQVMVTNTIEKMDKEFEEDSRYLQTVVNGFRNGSVIANTTVLMRGILTKQSDGTFPICNETTTDPDINLFPQGDCQSYMQQQEQSSCESSNSICPDTWQCMYQDSSPTCQHPCYIKKATDPGFCSSSSQICSVRVDGTTISAECTCMPSYLNAGGNCLHQNIVIIVASVVGGILLIVFIALVAAMAVRLNRKPNYYNDPYDAPRGGKRGADLWASVPDNTSQNLQPYADEFVANGTPEKMEEWPKRDSPRDSDSGRVTSGHDNQAFVGDENATGWNNIPLNDDAKGNNFHRDADQDQDQDKASDISALDIDDTYMRSLLSSDAYQEIGDTNFKITRPVLKMSNMKNTQREEEKSEGEEFVF